MSVDELEKAAASCRPEDRARLLKTLEEMDAAEWDRQIEADAKSGKLDRLANEALEDVKAGRFRKL